MDGFCTARAPACCHQRVPPGGVGRAPVLPPMTGVKRKVAGNGSFTTGRSQHRTCIMEEYNPGCAPEPESWLELDEQERIALVETYHRVARIKLPNVTAHAALHTIVENQIARLTSISTRRPSWNFTRSPGCGIKCMRTS